MGEIKEQQVNVPYIVYEGSMVRAERHAKRIIIALIMTVILLFVSNGLWLYAWMQYDYIASEISVDAQDGIANYIGNNGDITNGENSSKEGNKTP